MPVNTGMKIMGIDPGLKGGIAFYDGTTLKVYPTPVVVEEFVKNGKKSKRNLMDLEEVHKILLQEKPDKAVLEKVSARSGQGVTSMFRFGMNFGEFRGVMAGHQIKWVEVTPQKWKAEYDLSGEKDESLEMAKTLWPENAPRDFKLKKQDGMAEAALIAKFGIDNPSIFE